MWPGLLLAAAVALAAFALGRVPGLTGLSPLILAIVIGIVFRAVAGMPATARPGVVLSMRGLLRLAIVLLGLQLTAGQVAEVGVAGIAVIVATVACTFGFTVLLGRLLGVERGLTELIAAGTSICGASAVAAANTVTRARDEDVAYAVACVTLFGSVAMVVYPVLAGPAGLDPHAYGIWAGASIHEVAQVVAAAFQGGSEAGEIGSVAKLSRVMMLAPVVVALSLLASSRVRRGGYARGQGRAPVPWFVLGFIGMVCVNSVVAIPAEAKAAVAAATTFLLALALAGMGLETDLARLRARGLRPLVLGGAASLFIAGFSLGLIKAFL
ncbi:YeiH family protein [Skermanella rosea]|uniref:YeiH family protein n=1 Tax=Skermanella rosea TaxID=1817965 RepID=UPI001E5D78E1|nr:YeiH family protein [Skermanella rosea]UEM06009.1 YeiH family protein [Skermanella rosea]